MIGTSDVAGVREAEEYNAVMISPPRRILGFAFQLHSLPKLGSLLFERCGALDFA